MYTFCIYYGMQIIYSQIQQKLETLLYMEFKTLTIFWNIFELTKHCQVTSLIFPTCFCGSLYQNIRRNKVSVYSLHDVQDDQLKLILYD